MEYQCNEIGVAFLCTVIDLKDSKQFMKYIPPNHLLAEPRQYHGSVSAAVVVPLLWYHCRRNRAIYFCHHGTAAALPADDLAEYISKYLTSLAVNRRIYITYPPNTRYSVIVLVKTG